MLGKRLDSGYDELTAAKLKADHVHNTMSAFGFMRDTQKSGIQLSRPNWTEKELCNSSSALISDGAKR